MPDYDQYTVNDYLEDASFRCWVLQPTDELTRYWGEIISGNPTSADTIRQARIMLVTMEERFGGTAPDPIFREDIRAITDMARTSRRDVRKLKSGREGRYQNLFKIAASVVLCIGIGLWFFQRQNDTGEMLVQRNDTDAAITLFLSDSSMVILEKGSTLTYPGNFQSDTREVYLEGQAFFEVSKNPKRPFLVFANETVTKVLGTSFTVKAFKEDKSVLVSVKSGQVSVYSVNPDERGETVLAAKAVTLLPDEQVVFDRMDFELKKERTVKNASHADRPENESRIYEDTPVTEILHALEIEYGIDIIFDEKKLSDCLLNTQFDEEFLKEKLHAICKAIGASYEITDGQVKLLSNGCN